jgi:hypothetical protein
MPNLCKIRHFETILGIFFCDGLIDFDSVFDLFRLNEVDSNGLTPHLCLTQLTTKILVCRILC